MRNWPALALLLFTMGLVGGLPAEAQRRTMPAVVRDVVVRFGIRSFDAPADFRTADVPDQVLIRASFQDYAAGAQLVCVRSAKGERLEFYLDPQRSKAFRADGSAISVNDLLRGDELVLVASGLEGRRVVSKLLVPGPLSERLPGSLALDPVPLHDSALGVSLRPPKGWRRTDTRQGGILLAFEPRRNQSRRVPHLLVVREEPTEPGGEKGGSEIQFLGARNDDGHSVQESVSAMLVEDEVILVDVHRVPWKAAGALLVVGYSLAEDFQTLLPGFRAVAQQLAAP